MTRDLLPANLAQLGPLLDGTPEVQQRWIDRAAASLSPWLLLAIEQLACEIIDLRYPDDPGSLFNGRFRQGQRRKRDLHRLFDYAQARMIEQLLAQVEQVRGEFLTGELVRLRDARYLQRRSVLLTRQADELAHAIRAGLAHNPDFQIELTLSNQEHRHEVDLERLRAELVRAQATLDQPHQLLLKLYEVLTALSQYQMTLADRASRNPALADRLHMLSLGLTAVMHGVQGLINQLNADGSAAVTPEQLRPQLEAILALFMSEWQTWQQQTQTEPHP
jgi:hypothetical protein